MQTPETPEGVAHLKDSGHREQMTTGSQRDSREGKGRFDLLPARALFRVARIFEAGAKKYENRNWELGQPLARYLDSGLRHLACGLRGDTDEDHIAQAAWNILCFLETQDRIKEGLLSAELDDLPTNPTGFRTTKENSVLKKLRDAHWKKRFDFAGELSRFVKGHNDGEYEDGSVHVIAGGCDHPSKPETD